LCLQYFVSANKCQRLFSTNFRTVHHHVYYADTIPLEQRRRRPQKRTDNEQENDIFFQIRFPFSIIARARNTTAYGVQIHAHPSSSHTTSRKERERCAMSRLKNYFNWFLFALYHLWTNVNYITSLFSVASCHKIKNTKRSVSRPCTVAPLAT